MPLNMLILGASELWVTRWLTPIWLVSSGVALGLGVLAILLILFAILSKIPVFDQMRKSGWTGHVIAASVALLCGAGMALWLRGFYFTGNDARADEWGLVSLATAVLAALFSWSLFYCSSSRLMGELKSVLFEGVGAYILFAVVGLAAIGLLATPVAESPMDAIKSLPELISTGESIQQVTVPGIDPNANEAAFVSVDVAYDPRLLESASVSSDRNIVIGDAESLTTSRMPPVRIEARSEINWTRKLDPLSAGSIPSLMTPQKSPIPMQPGDQVFIQNQDIDPATIQFKLVTRPAVPEVSTIFVAAISVVALGLILLLQQGLAPKASAIALTAAKSEIAQPLFVLLVALGLLAIVVFVFLPFHTFGEDIKLLKDCGITIILVASLFQGVWSASSSVSEEIEGRTALTVLSKPVGRRSFLIGKMLGVFWILALMYLILGTALIVAVAYKPIYDAKENSLEMPLWQACHLEVIRTIPGLAMAFLQSLTLSAFSVAIATRLPQFANFAVCFSIYLIGHLTESLVGSAEGGFPILQFVGQLIAVVVPDLEHFSMQAAIDAGNPIPLAYLSGTLVYAILYLGLSLLLGLLLFEDRDLA